MTATSLLLLCLSLCPADAPAVAFETGDGRVAVTASGSPVVTYVFRDPKVTRPYLAHAHAPGKVRVSRNHPPLARLDATDHAEFHPGLWLAFGDLGGADGWRNKARVEHEKFSVAPAGGEGKGGFVASLRHLAADGKRTVCRETFRLTVVARPAGHLLMWDSTLRGDGADLVFGDQEEMGLGVRVATPLSVAGGGRILTSDGDRNEKGARGKRAEWCDYGGKVEGKSAGVTLMQHPKNFRPAWYHARDYGLLVANPFGKKSLTGGESGRHVVAKGEALRLRFGVLLHAGEKPPDLAAAHADYVKLSGE